MTLDNGDKAQCMEIAREIIKEVLTEHIKICPHGVKIKNAWMFILGAGAAGGYSISELVRHIFSG